MYDRESTKMPPKRKWTRKKAKTARNQDDGVSSDPIDPPIEDVEERREKDSCKDGEGEGREKDPCKDGEEGRDSSNGSYEAAQRKAERAQKMLEEKEKNKNLVEEEGGEGSRREGEEEKDDAGSETERSSSRTASDRIQRSPIHAETSENAEVIISISIVFDFNFWVLVKIVKLCRTSKTT